MADLFHISEAATIALHAAVLLASNPERLTTTRELAETLSVSEAHLAKVLQKLERAGLAEGVRGPAGGFRLTGSPKTITLMQVYEAVEGPARAGRCVFGVPVCNGDGCTLGPFFRDLSHQAERKLKQTRLSDIRMDIGG